MREDIERNERIIAALPTRAQTCVIKNNGIFERFTHEKIVKSCLMVGAPLWAAEKISSYVAKAAYDGISTAEIKMLVYDCLKKVDLKTAEISGINYSKSTYHKGHDRTIRSEKDRKNFDCRD